MPKVPPANAGGLILGDEPGMRVSGMQVKLHRWAVADPGRRFDDLFNFVYDPATLWVAFARVAGNTGARTAGVDGLRAADVPELPGGTRGFLDDLRVSLKDGSFRPLPVRERMIAKPGGSGKLRRLGIPTSGSGGPGCVEVGVGTHFRGRLRAGLLRVPVQPAGP